MVLKKQIIEENESLKITSICRFLMSVYAVSETKTFKSKSFCCCCSHIHENNRKALNAFPPPCAIAFAEQMCWMQRRWLLEISLNCKPGAHSSILWQYQYLHVYVESAWESPQFKQSARWQSITKPTGAEGSCQQLNLPFRSRMLVFAIMEASEGEVKMCPNGMKKKMITNEKKDFGDLNNR